MQFGLRQLLMLMVLIGLISGLAISVTVKPVTDVPRNIAVSSNGRRVATVSWNGRVTLYDMSEDAPIVRSKRLGRNNDFFGAFEKNNIQFVGEDKIGVVINSMNDRTALVWNLETNEVKEVETLARTAPVDLYIDSSFLIRANTSTGSVTIQDLREEDGEIRRVKNLNLNANAAANPFGYGENEIRISKDGNFLLLVEHDMNGAGRCNLTIVDAQSEKVISKKTLNLDWNTEVRFAPSGKHVGYVDGFGGLKILDQDLNEIGKFKAAPIMGLHGHSFRFSSDGKRVAVRDEQISHTISIYDTETLEKLTSIEIGKLGGLVDWMNSEKQSVFGFSEDSANLFLVPGSSDEGLLIHDVSTGKLTQRVGRIYRFLPGCLFGAGFCIWAIAWGLLARSEIRKRIHQASFSEEDVEFDADTISPQDLVLDESESGIETAIAVPPKLPPVIGEAPVMIGYDGTNFPVTPTGIRVAWILMTIGGIWGIFYASIGAFYITMSGLFSFEIVIYAIRIFLDLFLLISGLLALSRGAGRYSSKLILTSSFQMISIICCDFLNFSLGLVALICCSTGVAPNFIDPKKPRIGTLRNRDKSGQ